MPSTFSFNKKALGISGVSIEESSWVDEERSVQIDLLIDRRDHVINICEVKFTQDPFTLTKAYKTEFEKKIFAFREETQTRKSGFSGVYNNLGLEGEYTFSRVHSKYNHS